MSRRIATDHCRTAAWHLLAALMALLPLGAHAAGSRQLVTGGATQIEGTAGGGLVPWAVIAGYDTREEIAATAFATRVQTRDFDLTSGGAAIGIHNRVEFSLARQDLDLNALGPALGLPGAHLRQDILGAKLRLFGDVIYTAYPQVALGFQYKRQTDSDVPRALGVTDDSGVDIYLSATKVLLAAGGGCNVFLNGTARWTQANETGLLGFGGDRGGHHLNMEASAGLLLSRRFAAGVEYRGKSSNLRGLPEDDWRDLFIGWFPNRHLALTAAYVDLGTIAGQSDQTGWYLSVQGGF